MSNDELMNTFLLIHQYLELA